MSNLADFDVVVVGGGVAGSITALLLARYNFSVLLVERANEGASKAMSGGRLYAHCLQKIFPDFSERAPFEREIIEERLSILSTDSGTTLSYRHPAFGDKQTSFSVLRAKLDPWLMQEAEIAGVQLLAGAFVEKLHIEDNEVCGVCIGGEVIRSSVVILAEGCNSLLAEQHQLIIRTAPENMSIGIKEIIALPRSEIDARFSLEGAQGVAWLLAGEKLFGKRAEGFLYTNQDCLSLGVVGRLNEAENNLSTQLEYFKSHPMISPLIRGGELMEYAAKPIPEAMAFNPKQKLYGNSYLIVGDAAGFCLFNGVTIRGMDLAVLSAQAAAETLTHARDRNDFTSASLSEYAENLKKTHLFSTMESAKNIGHWLDKSPHFFSQYPEHFQKELCRLFAIDGAPPQKPATQLIRMLKAFGFLRLLTDMKNFFSVK